MIHYHLYGKNEILFSLPWGSSWLSENISEGGNCESRSLIVSFFTFSCHCVQWRYSWELVGKGNFYQGWWFEFDPWIPSGKRKEATPKSCALISTKGPWQVFAHIQTYICTFIIHTYTKQINVKLKCKSTKDKLIQKKTRRDLQQYF